MTDDLTLDQLERIIANHESGVHLTGVHVYRQLAGVMRERDSLAQVVRYVVDHAWCANTDRAGSWINEFVDVAGKALAKVESGELRNAIP